MQLSCVIIYLMDTFQIVTDLKAQGFKSTKLQHSLLELLARSKPLTVSELLKQLKKHYPTLNKTTLYRQLDNLHKSGWVKLIELGDGKKRYEMANSHHHHLVCQSCQAIAPVETDVLEAVFEQIEQDITQNLKFQILEHNLEFFGICQNCQKS